jgi:hypothetical protein
VSGPDWVFGSGLELLYVPELVALHAMVGFVVVNSIDREAGNMAFRRMVVHLARTEGKIVWGTFHCYLHSRYPLILTFDRMELIPSHLVATSSYIAFYLQGHQYSRRVCPTGHNYIVHDRNYNMHFDRVAACMQVVQPRIVLCIEDYSLAFARNVRRFALFDSRRVPYLRRGDTRLYGKSANAFFALLRRTSPAMSAIPRKEIPFSSCNQMGLGRLD